MSVTHAHEMLAEALQHAIAELDSLLDRHFAARRLVRVENTLDGRWCAVTSHSQIFPATDDLDVVIRFVRAFAMKTPNVNVDEDSVEYARMLRTQSSHSVRVPALRAVT